MEKNMNALSILDKIKKEPFTRENIYNASQSKGSTFKDYNIRTIVDSLLVNDNIVRVGRNRYIKKQRDFCKKEYYNIPTNDMKKLMSKINNKYPKLSYVIWESKCLNEFLNHLIAKNYIFIEVEKSGCEYVYNLIKEKNKNVLLYPTEKEMNYYSENNGIVVDKLISEVPKNIKDEHLVSIEKIIVDLFAEKKLLSMFSKGDYPDMLERMFNKYMVNQNKLFRYAKRRNKEKEIVEFIKDKTNIELIKEEVHD